LLENADGEPHLLGLAVLAPSPGLRAASSSSATSGPGRGGGLPAITPAAPFIRSYAAFSLSVDPTLPPEKASYNVAMAFTITSFMIASFRWAVATYRRAGGPKRKTGARRSTRAKPSSQLLPRGPLHITSA
jgi:hypothetical protein